jgi:hypothetical protein
VFPQNLIRTRKNERKFNNLGEKEEKFWHFVKILAQISFRPHKEKEKLNKQK